MINPQELKEVTPEDMEIRKSIKVGDKVRSYDFHPAIVGKEMYVEGIVTDVDGFVLAVDVTKDSVANRTSFTVPIQSMFMDFPERIMKIN